MDLKCGRQGRACPGYQETVEGGHASQVRKGLRKIEIQEMSHEEWTQRSPEPKQFDCIV